MSVRERVRTPSCAGHRARAMVLSAGLAVAALGALPASAYVVVTSDNRVYTVPTRPELSGDLVFFTLNGQTTSLRIYDVNLRATNELNSLMDSGASARDVDARVARLPQAVPVDQRLMASSPLHRWTKEKQERERGSEVARGAAYPPPSSTAAARGAGYPPPSSYAAPPRSSSPFAAEARQAMDEAERYSQPAAPPRGSHAAPPSRAPESDRLFDLDAEIAAEQAYLRQLTAGEVVVDDLDREIERSMEKVGKLQKKRDKIAANAAQDEGLAEGGPPPPPMQDFRGTYPPGSREAGWEREIAESRVRLQELRAEQERIPAGSSQERESVDEQIGEIEHRIQRLQEKLARTSR